MGVGGVGGEQAWSVVARSDLSVDLCVPRSDFPCHRRRIVTVVKGVIMVIIVVIIMVTIMVAVMAIMIIIITIITITIIIVIIITIIAVMTHRHRCNKPKVCSIDAGELDNSPAYRRSPPAPCWKARRGGGC
jgi:amino acid transporter